jgi:pyruvate dehydrogenase E1 component beta subunit
VRELTYNQARNEIVAHILRTDPRVVLIGARFTSPFEPPNAQLAEFGPDRLIDVPIAELGYSGAGVGAALAGMRPIVGISTGSFMFNAYEQVVNEAAKLRYMSGGQVSVPVVFHCHTGVRAAGGPQHTHPPHAMLANAPGLKLIAPATPADVQGLLLSAIDDGNPVVFLDHLLLQDVRGPVPDEPTPVPLGRASVMRQGRDATIVASSIMVQRALVVADRLAGEGIEVEVLDVRTLVPLDRETILGSVRRTGRVVVADESYLTCGYAAELAAVIADEAFYALKAPVKRVAIDDVPAPFSPALEPLILPSVEKLEVAVRKVLEPSRAA